MELAFLNGDFSPSNQYNSIQEYINQIGCSSFISSNVHKFTLAWGKRNDGGLHPDAWHQKPSINDVCRLHEAQWSEDIEDVRISQSGLPTLSGPRRAQWLPPPAGRGQYSYGYPRKLRNYSHPWFEKMWFYSGQQWFFCTPSFLHFKKCMKYEEFDRPAVKICGILQSAICGYNKSSGRYFEECSPMRAGLWRIPAFLPRLLLQLLQPSPHTVTQTQAGLHRWHLLG